MGLYEFDVSRGEISREVLVEPDVDIIDVVVDYAHRELIAGVYERDGERRVHYLQGYADLHLEKIQDRLPRERVSVVTSSGDRTRFVLWVSGPRNPGTYYYHDVETGELVKIARALNGIDPSVLVDVEAFWVVSKDGLSIEAFLALPKEIPADGAALVVIPHGGPIGVRDNRDFNPVVQYLASAGFAVLNVNYRGSSGYGRRFQEAGKQEWAKGIEDDVDAAVEVAMRRPDIDSSRVCIAGGSYGGFSALASVVRHPGRYRCAATINGVTDIPLLFETSDFSYSDKTLPIAKEQIGDVDANRRSLMDASPLYHVDEIESPVLIVYGTEDRRVDPDHAHRLIVMMDLLGKSYEATEVVGAGHSFTYAESQSVWPRLREFLTEHLRAGSSEGIELETIDGES
jgi:dipeptidyl aminopeptidase/acylaminoacyl peptidase